jgi:hypothetical protein
VNIGIIAEDRSDVDVLKALAVRMLGTRSIGFKQFLGHGCGPIRRKCGAWARDLAGRGCSWVVVAQDLDLNDEAALRRDLEQSIADTPALGKVVLIPIKEIEAWLLYDALALRTAFKGKGNPAIPGNPEQLDDPKRELGDIVRREYDTLYLNTIHNGAIAKHIDPSRLARSRSFTPYPVFVRGVRAQRKLAHRGVSGHGARGRGK